MNFPLPKIDQPYYGEQPQVFPVVVTLVDAIGDDDGWLIGEVVVFPYYTIKAAARKKWGSGCYKVFHAHEFVFNLTRHLTLGELYEAIRGIKLPTGSDV